MNRHPTDRLAQQTAILVLTTTARLYAPAAVGASHARAAPNAIAPPVVGIVGVVAPERPFWARIPERPPRPRKSASNINDLQGAKKGSNPYANAPLNVLGSGSFRWPGVSTRARWKIFCAPKLERRREPQTQRKAAPFVAVYRLTMKSDAWRALSVGAKATFLELRKKYNTKAQCGVLVGAGRRQRTWCSPRYGLQMDA